MKFSFCLRNILTFLHMRTMWNKLDYLSTRNGSGNQVVWNKVDCGTKCCRFALYVVYNIFLSVEDYRFYLTHLSLYDNLYKEINIITFVSALNYAVEVVEWLGDWFTVHWKVLWAKRLCLSHNTIPGYLSGSAYNNHENPENSRCSAMESNPTRLVYRSRYYNYASLFYARFGLWSAL